MKWKIVLPVVVLVVAATGAFLLVHSRDKPESREPEPLVPLVRVETVRIRDLDLTVSSQGTVRPRTVTELVPEVSGRVVEVSPSFVSGGFFEAGALLLRIDPHDYRQALVQAEAAVAQTRTRLTWEQAEAESARREWEELGGEGDPPPLTLREPQVAEARAALSAAEAAVEQAQRNLERTEIRSPYLGRVRDKRVDVGQFVNRGTPLGTVYAIDYAEIRLPLPDDELAFVDLPLSYRGERQSHLPEVTLRADFAGREYAWRGRIVRTEGEIDPESRMVHAVARVSDPYGRSDDPERPPLAAGMFVRAEIVGRTIEAVAVIPRAALRVGDQVLVVDSDDRLRIRDVEVLRGAGDDVVVSAGLEDGDRLCLSPLTAVTDGMKVRVTGAGRSPA